MGDGEPMGDHQAGAGCILTQQEEILVVVQCRVPEQVPLVQPQLLPALQSEVHGHVLEDYKLLKHNTLSMTLGLGSGVYSMHPPNVPGLWQESSCETL